MRLRSGVALAIVQLRFNPAAPIQPLAWERACATGAALKRINKIKWAREGEEGRGRSRDQVKVPPFETGGWARLPWSPTGVWSLEEGTTQILP